MGAYDAAQDREPAIASVALFGNALARRPPPTRRRRAAAIAARLARARHRAPRSRAHRAVARGRLRRHHPGERRRQGAMTSPVARRRRRLSWRTIRAIMRREFTDVLPRPPQPAAHPAVPDQHAADVRLRHPLRRRQRAAHHPRPRPRHRRAATSRSSWCARATFASYSFARDERAGRARPDQRHEPGGAVIIPRRLRRPHAQPASPPPCRR